MPCPPGALPGPSPRGRACRSTAGGNTWWDVVAPAPAGWGRPLYRGPIPALSPSPAHPILAPSYLNPIEPQPHPSLAPSHPIAIHPSPIAPLLYPNPILPQLHPTHVPLQPHPNPTQPNQTVSYAIAIPPQPHPTLVPSHPSSCSSSTLGTRVANPYANRAGVKALSQPP